MPKINDMITCKVTRTKTGTYGQIISRFNVEIPTEIGNDPFAIARWIGEEFNWQFVPLGKYHKNFTKLRNEL